MMVDNKTRRFAVKAVSLVVLALFSLFVVAEKLPQSSLVETSRASLEDSSDTVMELAAATMATSLAISALPDDFATPLADTLADMNVYFVIILVALYLERVILWYGVRAAFAVLIPMACCFGLLFMAAKRPWMKNLAIRLCALGMTVAFLIPCCTGLTGLVASGLNDYVRETIQETEEGADKLNEAMEDTQGDKTIFEKLSDLFRTAIRGVSDLLLHFQDTIRKCMNSIAILILTNCVMPLVTCFLFKWILGEIFQIAMPNVPLRRYRRRGDPETAAEDGHSEGAGDSGEGRP